MTVQTEKTVPSIYAKYFDKNSRSWDVTPNYNKIFLKAQQNYVNNLLQARGHVFLNDVYDILGIDRTQVGVITGWILNNDSNSHISFGIDEIENCPEGSILLDFNVDGIIYDKI